ncbi:hypothetical protein [Lactobacillus nasalidis]|uniref:hypothetical protein n=1 Tax=Lactobacillus nasalidis TaxID=2797258 RepID=UPI0019151F12|nr:hypothetical protein [Lactobacillus nasalidis]
MKIITKILQAISFVLGLFLLWEAALNLADFCNSAKLMGWSTFAPSIIAESIFIIMLVGECWLSLQVNSLSDRGVFFALTGMLLLTAGEMIAPVSLGSGFLWLNLLLLLMVLLARFAVDFRQ